MRLITGFKLHFSGKQNLYGCKVEVVVRANGMAVDFSKNYSGFDNDFTVLTKRHTKHGRRSAKGEDDEQHADEGLLAEKYPEQRAMLADKVYQSGSKLCRVVSRLRKHFEVYWTEMTLNLSIC